MGRVVLMAVLAGVLGLALFVAGIPGLCADDFMRVFMAVRWADYPVPLQIAIWPPLQSYLYGPLIYLGLPPLHLAHCLSALFAAATVFLAGKSALSISGRSGAALGAAFLVLVSPVQILLSASMLAEPLYSVCALTMALFLHRWLLGRSRRDLWVALLSCTLLTMSRLDGWPIAFAFALFLFVTERGKDRWAHVLVVVAFPLVWLLLMAARFGDAFVLFRSYAQATSHFVRQESAVHFNPWVEFLRYYPVGALALVWGLGKRRSDPPLFILALVTAATLLLQYLVTLQRGQELFAPRILVVPGLLSLILAGIWLSRARVPVAGALVALSLATGAYHLVRFRPEYDREMAAIGERLARSASWREVSRRELFGSDLPTWKLPVVALLSGHPKAFQPIVFDPEIPKVWLPYPNPPRNFLLESPEAAAILARNYPGTQATNLGPATLLTGEAALLEELRKP